MTPIPIAPGPEQTPGRIAEIAIKLGLLALLLIWCFQILRPFIVPTVWGIIIAVAIFPLYRRLVRLTGGRNGLAATLVAGGCLVLLLVPSAALAPVLIRNVAALVEHVRAGQLAIPPPPVGVKEWPLIGEFVANLWGLASTNLVDALKLVQPQLLAFGSWLLEIAASAGIGFLIVIFAFGIAGVLLAHSESCHRIAYRIAARLAGERGEEFAHLAESTIRSVARGVLGVAVIQALLAGLGFMVAGVPGAGIWAFLCLISAVMQIGVGPILIPAIVYVFATGDTLTAVAFLVWGVLIMVLDNILKPLLLGRGTGVPMMVIFLGAIGGLLLSGIVGLFVGAIVLAVGYRLFQAWLGVSPASGDRPAESSESRF